MNKEELIKEIEDFDLWAFKKKELLDILNKYKQYDTEK